MESLRVFALGDMNPRGDPHHDDTRFVRETNTSHLAHIIEGAARHLWELGQIEQPENIVAIAPDESDRTGIVSAVLTDIENSDLIVVDISTESPSVIYELGAVNALGLPYILVTSRSTLPFYLTQVRAILNFTFVDGYDRDDASHLELRNRLLRNYRSADQREATESRFSEYFGGLPIVNISGPVSMALGYHVNFLNRFGMQDYGLLSRPVQWAKGASVTQDISDVVEVQPRHLVVVIPDIAEYADYNSARRACEKAMRDADLPLDSVSLLEGEGQNLRLGMGVLIVRDHPDIVLDIPRTLFPLLKSPRILTALSNGGRFADKDVRERTSRRLLRDFRMALDWNMGLAAQGTDAPWHRVHFVEQQDLAERVAALID